MNVQQTEAARLILQAELDAEKTAKERNFMGQFATPPALAQDIIRYGNSLLTTGQGVRFLDPALGTGSFYAALKTVVKNEDIDQAIGIEIDAHYGDAARRLWKSHGLDCRLTDFTTAKPKKKDKANLLICNPPYVRHHHLSHEQKTRLKTDVERVAGVQIGGLSGLYCYFMGLADQWMVKDGVAGWLIPSEFMDVNYGRYLKSYLLDKVTLVKIHRFDPTNVQFDDALVSSAVVWLRNTPPPTDHAVEFSYGGTLENPDISRFVTSEELRGEKKWTRYPLEAKPTKKSRVTLGDLFKVRRGIATGDNKFFIMSRDQIEEKGLPFKCFRPILPSSRYVKTDHIKSNSRGNPVLQKQLFLLDTKLSEDEISARYPQLADYLSSGKVGEKPAVERYICKSRRPWYAQESIAVAPIICTYMGRPKEGARPFRFIRNDSDAITSNVYLNMYPTPALERIIEETALTIDAVWECLNAIPAKTLLGAGRVYGGGLHKMEPKELLSVDAEELFSALPEIMSIKPKATEYDKAA